MKKVGGWGRINTRMREISPTELASHVLLLPSRYPETRIMILEKKHSRMDILAVISIISRRLPFQNRIR